MKLTTKQKEQIKKIRTLFKKRILNGIKFLDSKYEREDWIDKLNPLSIQMTDGNTCIIGQTFGDFFGEFDFYDKEAIELGFQLPRNSAQWKWDFLGYMWAVKLVDLKLKNGF